MGVDRKWLRMIKMPFDPRLTLVSAGHRATILLYERVGRARRLLEPSVICAAHCENKSAEGDDR
jgi:hypothetical protein